MSALSFGKPFRWLLLAVLASCAGVSPRASGGGQAGGTGLQVGTGGAGAGGGGPLLSGVPGPDASSGGDCDPVAPASTSREADGPFSSIRDTRPEA